jgi:hypothetical protein
MYWGIKLWQDRKISKSSSAVNKISGRGISAPTITNIYYL